jgi:hypothetical protein
MNSYGMRSGVAYEHGIAAFAAVLSLQLLELTGEPLYAFYFN